MQMHVNTLLCPSSVLNTPFCRGEQILDLSGLQEATSARVTSLVAAIKAFLFCAQRRSSTPIDSEDEGCDTDMMHSTAAQGASMRRI